MKTITSSRNPAYKNLKQLISSTKARRKVSQTVLEGIHLAESYLAAEGLVIDCFVSESAASNREVQAIIAQLEARELDYKVVPDRLMQPLSSVDNGIGLLLVVPHPVPKPPEPLTDTAVLLDSIQDPGNVGTMLRTAAAAGVKTVYCSSATAAAWSPKVLRAGMGAHFNLEIYEDVDLTNLIQKSTVLVLVTSLSATQTVYQTDLRRPLAWLFGNEGQGVSAELLDLATEQVLIPQADDVESLNVSAAVAVCLFEQRRQSLG